METRLQSLFEKYLERRCSPDEVTELVQLLQEADAAAVLSEPMRRLWDDMKDHTAGQVPDWNRMYETITHTETDLLALNRRRKQPVRSKQGFLIAVVLVILAASAAWWSYSGAPDPKAMPSLARTNPSHRIPVPHSKQTIHLPDGSTVVLNTGSKLDYPAVFSRKSREVYLTGEAYFDIVHKAGSSFLVHTGKITTRVLGTAFDIRAYPGDEAVQVTVQHGKVQVLKESRDMGLLTDNQQLSVNKVTDTYKRIDVDALSVMTWKPQEISFDDVTMEEAARSIGQRFRTTIGFTHEFLKNCRVTASFSEEDSLEEMLTVICGVTRSSYVIGKDTVTIDGKGCE